MTELMLKLAAFLAMVIDHAAACRLDRVSAQPAETRVKLRLRRIDREAAAGEQEHRKPFGLNHPRQRLFMEENQQNQPDKQRKQNI